jgi:hypothetical protein
MLTAISNIICRKVYTVKKGYDFPVLTELWFSRPVPLLEFGKWHSGWGQEKL